jgi:flagellar protein FliJ
MSKPFPLQTVLDLMQTRADDAARELGKLIAQEQDAKKRLQLLDNYRDEYHARFLAAAQNGLSPLQWSNFQAFLGKLDEAILHQQRLVEASADRTAAGQKSWLDQRNKVQAFDSLAQKHDARERYVEGRQDQKHADEFAARKFRDDRGDE